MKSPIYKLKVWDIELIKSLLHPLNYRRSGRTTAIAEAFVQLAKENIGVEIKLLDHYPEKEATNNLIQIIKDKILVLNKEEYNKGSQLRYNLRRDSIICNYIKDITPSDWENLMIDFKNI